MKCQSRLSLDSPCPTRFVISIRMTIHSAIEIGDVVEVSPASPGVPLPPGLPAGAQVRLIRVEREFRVVERDGCEWRVAAQHLKDRSTSRRPMAVKAKPANKVRGRENGFEYARPYRPTTRVWV